MDYYISIIIYIILGILPSLIWLSYYLSKDLHPEPKRMIVKIFLWGALMAIPVIFIELGLDWILDLFKKIYSMDLISYNLIYFFLIISPVEEFFKYLVVRVKVINSPHLDEPLDIMLYMVVTALGFAAVENVFYFLRTMGQSLEITSAVYIVRFIGAVFLHTLCSAVIGYFLAISFCEIKLKRTRLVLGILIAVALHGIYDFSIITVEGLGKYIIPVTVIITLAFIVFAAFEELKNMKSICKIK